MKALRRNIFCSNIEEFILFEHLVSGWFFCRGILHGAQILTGYQV